MLIDQRRVDREYNTSNLATNKYLLALAASYNQTVEYNHILVELSSRHSNNNNYNNAQNAPNWVVCSLPIDLYGD